MRTKIWLSPPHMCGKEQAYVNEAFASNWVAPLGPMVDEFENELSACLGIPHVAALSSGTAAIHLALVMLDVKPGDEVIASSFTFSATVNPIVYLGAVPVLIDSEPSTWNMDPVLLEEAITDRLKKGKKPAAIIVVDLYGMPARLDKILEIAEKYEIPVIEDAAEALGSRFDGKNCGSFGKMGILSFNGNKIITTSGGGALVSKDPEKISTARFLATQARDEFPHYEHTHIGYNYRMSNILAAIGKGQLEVIGDRVAVRRKINTMYRELLKDNEVFSFQTEPDSRFFSNYWLTCILINSDHPGTDRENIRIRLQLENIDSRPLWKPMHMQPVFKHYPVYVNGTSERLFEKGLCLPSGSNMPVSDLELIAGILQQASGDLS